MRRRKRKPAPKQYRCENAVKGVGDPWSIDDRCPEWYRWLVKRAGARGRSWKLCDKHARMHVRFLSKDLRHRRMKALGYK